MEMSTQCQQEASSEIALEIISKRIENKPAHFLRVQCRLLVFPVQCAFLVIPSKKGAEELERL